MRYQQTLRLRSDESIDPEVLLALHVLLHQCGVEVFDIDEEVLCLEECKDMILARGASEILSTQRLLEAVLSKTKDRDDRDLLVRILCQQLERLVPSESLIVVDAYLFPTNLQDQADYIKVIQEIFGPVISGIASISFITKPDFDAELYQDIKRNLEELNLDIHIGHKTTNDFHDRMWIADRRKGLFVGTSLNGLGKKYAITDYMKDEDTASIVEELSRLDLI